MTLGIWRPGLGSATHKLGDLYLQDRGGWFLLEVGSVDLMEIVRVKAFVHMKLGVLVDVVVLKWRTIN